jgi:uncharacterized protein (TIGR02996 family)
METALRQAIANSPHDDLPKLVFADWLDENARVVEAMFVRHYVLFGDINYGCIAGRDEVPHFLEEYCGGDSDFCGYGSGWNLVYGGEEGGSDGCGDGHGGDHGTYSGSRGSHGVHWGEET